MSRWIMFRGGHVFLSDATISRINELGGPLKEMKTDHIPSFSPKSDSFSLFQVNDAVKIVKDKKGKDKEVVPDWSVIRIE